jgi:diguanylate cyclase (GGDEF)-like protein
LAGAALHLGASGRGVLAAWNACVPATPLILEAAAAALGAALENRARLGELEAEVNTDDLTRVYNYRYLRHALQREVGRARRLGHPLALLMLDVDHLKEYNERFGHLEGSQVLRAVAGVLRTSTREIDLVTKYGGDEFLLILPHTGRAGAEVLAERLRRAVAAAAFPRLAAGELTCSIGVAVFPEGGTSAEALLAAADAALFEAKRAGRNRVCSA